MLCYSAVRLVVEVLGRDDVKSVSPKLYHFIDKVQVPDIRQFLAHHKINGSDRYAIAMLGLLLCFAIQQSQAGCGDSRRDDVKSVSPKIVPPH